MPRKPRAQSSALVVQNVQEAPTLPTPERNPHEPQRAIEKQLARRRIIYDCLLLGVKDNAGILHALAQKGCGVSEKTMIKDREAVRTEIREAYKQESRELTEDIVMELDGIAKQSQLIASDIKYSGHVKVQALGQKKEALVAKSKLLGLVVEKQEHSGSVTNVNLNREVSKDEAREFVKALKDVDLDVEDAA